MIHYFRQQGELSDEELQLMALHFHTETYKKRTVIFRPPAICYKAYFICNGIIGQSYEIDGNEITAYIYLKNSFFTDLQSFLEQKPSRYSFYAVTACSLQSITHSNLEKLYKAGVNFERWGRKVFENISLELIRTAENLRFLSPEERFDKLLSDSPQLLQLLPQKHIAAILGVTPESFSRLKKRAYTRLKS